MSNTVLHAVPAVFRELASRLAPGQLLPHLRAIHLGGDTVYASDVELFRRCTLAHCMVVNQLASTEAGVIAQNIIGHQDRGTTGVVVSVSLRQIFTGRFKRYDVGTAHAQALDPRNPVFAAALQRCVGLIRDAARVALEPSIGA